MKGGGDAEGKKGDDKNHMPLEDKGEEDKKAKKGKDVLSESGPRGRKVGAWGLAERDARPEEAGGRCVSLMATR